MILKVALVYFCLTAINGALGAHHQLTDDRVVSWKDGHYIFPSNKSFEFGLEIFSPSIPGQYPVVVFLPGLEGIVPGFVYTEACTELVIQSNSIVITFEKLRYPVFPDKIEDYFEATLNWTLSNIIPLFNSNNTPSTIKGLVFPDLKSSGVSLMSHSAGAHGIGLYLIKRCGLVSSLILLDPVDGYDPFGIFKIFLTHPPAKLNFTIPTLIVASGLSSIKDGVLVPCAPANISNNRFYDSLAGPTWYLNLTDYGHADILDNWVRDYVAKFVCKSCSSTKNKCDYDLYRTQLVNTVSYFLIGLRQKSSYYINALQNPQNSTLFNPSIKIESKYDLHGYDVTKTGPFCLRS